MSVQDFSIGEWVQRRMDGKVGVVKKAEPYNDGHVYYVEFQDEPGEVWAGFTPAWDRYHRLHAHMEGSSRDCDGTYTYGHVYEMTTQERADQFGDLEFKNRVVANVMSLHAIHGTLTVTEEGVEWNEQTEEGFRTAGVRWCEDDCPDERSWQRDHRAEEMGY